MTESALPALSPEEAAHSERLLARIIEEIEAAGGWISFERFMELALYAPGLGYYSAGATKLGAAGDFVTAPEISPLFSRCLANQCMEVLGRLGGGEILEFGAGSGIMAADLLTELAARGECPERYLILEVSAELRTRQQATLAAKVPALLSRVQWLDALPDSMTGVILGNEVLDALPVQRFHVRGGEVNSVGVTWQLGKLDWSEVRADDALTVAVRQIETDIGHALPDGYRSEINLRLKPWVAGLAKTLTRGAAFLIDYGLPRREYYRTERSMGTLLCHYRHRFHDDPLINLGLQDIGAWVDFTAVASAGIDAALKIGGFATQAHFLIGNGIERLLADLASRELTARVQVARQAMVLTLPGEMGERFKVLALTRDYDAPLAGFSVRDMAASL
jgi:SAM-dependent MidA family methyltransferase